MPAYRTYINYIAARIIHFKGLSMQQFEIAFSGQILPGAQLEEVKAAIARMFQADATLLARLFSGQRVVIKKDLDAAGVAKYQGAFQRAGAVLEVLDISAPIIEEITPGLPVEEPAVPAPSAPTPTPQSPPTDSAKPKMLQITPRDEYMAAFSDVQAPDFGIAPVGDDLQPTPVEKPAPQLDLSGISLAPIGCDMGELPRAKAIIPPDISHIKLVD